MKRLTVWMAALALLVLLTACGGERKRQRRERHEL